MVSKQKGQNKARLLNDLSIDVSSSMKKFSSTENINKNQISVIMDSIISILNNFETLKKMHAYRINC